MLALLIPVFTMSLAFSSAWNEANDPFAFDRNFNTYFNQLPAQGELKDNRLGWPGNHWANYLGGVAHRWSAANPQNFTYKMHSLTDLKKMDQNKINELSPAEKFDIYKSNYNYPITRKVLGRLSPRENEWHGICHGYAPAALNHPEPARVTLKNRDGISITFYSSDVAALMSHYYAKVITTPVVLIGKRCNYMADTEIPQRSQSACDDLNAGAFHIVLGNKLGLKGTGFIADIDRYFEVWNHIAVNFNSIYRAELEPSKSSAEGTVKRVQVETIVTYAAAIAPKFDPVIGTDSAEYAQNTYEYYLDLDEKGFIIGGDWIGDKRPDFVWSQKKAIFNGDWAALNEIYRPATVTELD